MHVNKKWKEGKKMIWKGSEAIGMAKPKETRRPMEEKNISKLNMIPIFIIFINTITSMQKMKVELKKDESSPQEY